MFEYAPWHHGSPGSKSLERVGEASYSISALAKPDVDVLGEQVDEPHEWQLRSLLIRGLLVDTHCVDPYGEFSLAKAQVPQRRLAAGRDEESHAVA